MRYFTAASAFLGSFAVWAARQQYNANKSKNTNFSSSSNNNEFVAFASSTGASGADTPNTASAGHWIDGLPEFAAEEVELYDGVRTVVSPFGKGASVKKQQTAAQQDHDPALPDTDRPVWVVFRSGVYDITDFIAEHPGGSKRLLMAAGTTIEPFWQQFPIHDQAEIFKLLEKHRIGNLKGAKDAKFEPLRGGKANAGVDMMWANEPVDARDVSLVRHSQRPFNAEAAPESLLPQASGGKAVMPNEKAFIRSHLPVPKIDVADFCLEIGGDNMEDDVCVTLEQLKAAFPTAADQIDVANTIQCGGNRRAEAKAAFADKPIKGISWRSGAISTSQWTGAPLRELLLKHSKDPQLLEQMSMANNDVASSDFVDYHVHFHGADTDAAANFQTSVPLWMALDPSREALVAWAMNSAPIPADHGYPLRGIVPGTVGARNCKWLSSISVEKHPSTGDWHARDYRKFPPHEKDAGCAHKYEAVYDMPVQSAITSAEKKGKSEFDAKTKSYHKFADSVSLKGFAYSGGGSAVTKVEVSTDGGKTFLPQSASGVTLSDGGISQKPGRRWAWKHFTAEVPLPAHSELDERVKVCVRATNDKYETQPQMAPYNFRGLWYNSYSCVDV